MGRKRKKKLSETLAIFDEFFIMLHSKSKEDKFMFCKKCGAEIADNAAFCPKCGERVNQVPPAGNPYPNQNYQQPYGGNPYGYNNGYHRPAVPQSAGHDCADCRRHSCADCGIAVLGTDMKAMSYVKYLGGGIAGALVFEIILGIVMIVAGICSLIFCNKKRRKGQYGICLGVIVGGHENY